MNLVRGAQQSQVIEEKESGSKLPSMGDYGHNPNVGDVLPSDNMLMLGDVLAIVKMSKATYYRRMKDPKNPAPKPAGRHNTNNVWRKDEVLAYAELIFSNFKPCP